MEDINLLTLQLAKKYTDEHGGGGGGTSNYNDLSNKPQIGGTTLTGNKSASDLGLVAAVEGKGLSTNDYTDADKVIVGGVTAALAGKQNVLTEGNNIKIDNNTISVNRWAVPAGKVVYTVITSDENYGQNVHVQRHTLGGALIDDRTFLCEMYKTVTIDDLISIYNPYASFKITLLKNSDEHQAGYSYTVNPITTPTSNSFTFMMEQEENDNDLIIREELDSAIGAIKDGQSIDSFADVETALAGKQATLTFDDTPTDGSNNPVKSNGIYDALALKQNATDNNLATTSKTVVGAVNELKSGFTTLDNEVNGDATTYPYADVITIEDAVPANVADCSVKIEPVQDLHGYDHPWVGGAGKNQAYDVEYSDVTAQYGLVMMASYKLKQGKRYVISFDTPNSGVTVYRAEPSQLGFNSLSLYSFNCNGTRKSMYGVATADADFTGKNILYRYDETSATGTGELSNLQIEEVADDVTTPTDYAPYENICPITGHTEVDVTVERPNLLVDADWVDNKYITQDGSIGNMEGMYRYTNNYIGVSGNTLYAIHEHQNVAINLAMAVAYYDSDKTFIRRDIVVKTSGVSDYTAQFTTPVNCRYVRANVALQSDDVMMQEGVFGHKTYTIALGDTIYGGTVDFDSGVMTVDRAIVDLGSLNWTYQPGNMRFISSAITNCKTYAQLRIAPIKCSALTPITDGRPYEDLPDKCIYIADGYDSAYAHDSDYTDGALFKTAMNGVQLCYELATPTTVQLTPQQIQLLKGQNTITASTGQISVTVNGVSGSIGAVQEQVNGLTRAIGWDDARNIFNGLIRQGYVNATGEYVGNALRWVCTTKQECKENTTYTVSASSSFLTRKISVMYFDSNDTIISYSEFDHEASPVNINATITTPDNTAYIIVDIANQKNADGYNITPSDVWDVQIEEGTQVTPYIPYHPVIGTAVNKLLTKVPDAPTTDGTYSLQVTVASGVPTYSWVSNA